MQVTIGALMLLLGLASGAILVAAAGFGLGAPGWVAWVLFPALTLAGYVGLMPARLAPQIGRLSGIAGGLLLALAAVALVLVFLDAAGLFPAAGGTMALWYVLAVGLPLGSLIHSLRGVGRGDTQ